MSRLRYIESRKGKPMNATIDRKIAEGICRAHPALDIDAVAAFIATIPATQPNGKPVPIYEPVCARFGVEPRT